LILISCVVPYGISKYVGLCKFPIKGVFTWSDRFAMSHDVARHKATQNDTKSIVRVSRPLINSPTY
jgi:hypothetical protein